MGYQGHSTILVQVPDEVKDAFDRVILKSFERMQKVIRATSPAAAALVVANHRGLKASHRRHMFCVIVYLLDKASPKQLEGVIAEADAWVAQLEVSASRDTTEPAWNRPQGGE